MEHFQTKKPRDKARREFRRWRVSPAGYWGARAMRRPATISIDGEVSGFFKAVWAFYFQQKKIAYGVGYANSRRGRPPSTRQTPGFRILYVEARLKQSRQNSPEGLVYGNSNATTALANSRLVIPALWVLAAKITH